MQNNNIFALGFDQPSSLLIKLNKSRIRVKALMDSNLTLLITNVPFGLGSCKSTASLLLQKLTVTFILLFGSSLFRVGNRKR